MVLFLLYWLFCMGVLLQAIVVSFFLTQVVFGLIIAIVFYFAQYLFILLIDDTTSYTAYWFISLLSPHVSVSKSFDVLLQFQVD